VILYQVSPKQKESLTMNKKKAILLSLSLALYSLDIMTMENESMSVSPETSPSSLMHISPTNSPGQSNSPLSSSPISTPLLLKGAANKSQQLLEEKYDLKSQKEPSKKFIFSTTVKPSGPGFEAWPVLNMIFPSKSKAVDTDLKGGALCSNVSQDATGDMLAALIDLNKKSSVEYELRILHIITAMLDNEIPTNKSVIEATRKHLIEKMAICSDALSSIENGMPPANKNEKEEM
jgi:hypothetical protein